MSLKLEISRTIDESNILEIIRKRLSRHPAKIFELPGVVGVTR
jgi:hypothetical protein